MSNPAPATLRHVWLRPSSVSPYDSNVFCIISHRFDLVPSVLTQRGAGDITGHPRLKKHAGWLPMCKCWVCVFQISTAKTAGNITIKAEYSVSSFFFIYRNSKLKYPAGSLFLKRSVRRKLMSLNIDLTTFPKARLFKKISILCIVCYYWHGGPLYQRFRMIKWSFQDNNL